MWHALPPCHSLPDTVKAWFRYIMFLVAGELESNSVILKPMCRFSFNIWVSTGSYLQMAVKFIDIQWTPQSNKYNVKIINNYLDLGQIIQCSILCWSLLKARSILFNSCALDFFLRSFLTVLYRSFVERLGK